MLEALSVRPHICEQIRSGPLGHWVDDFVDVLSTRGYATSTMRRYVRAAAIFSAWLDQQRVAATDIDETLVTRFVTGLPRRRLRRARSAYSRMWQAASVCWPFICGHEMWLCAAAWVPLEARPRSGCSASTITSCKCTGWLPAPGRSTAATPQPFLPNVRGRRHSTGPGSPC